MKWNIIIISLILCGCTTLDTKVTTREDLNKTISNLNLELEKVKQDNDNATAHVIINKQIQLQKAADKLAEAQISVAQIPISRAQIVTSNKLDETAAVLPAGAVSAENYKKLLNQLNESITSNDELKKQHEEALKDYITIKQTADAAQTALVDAETRLKSKEIEHANKVSEALDNYAKTQEKALAEEQAKSNKEDAKRDMYLARTCYSAAGLLVIISILCFWQTHIVLGALCVTFAGGCVGTGYYLPLMPKWIFPVACIVIIIFTIGGMYWAYRRGLFQKSPSKIGDMKVVEEDSNPQNLIP